MVASITGRRLIGQAAIFIGPAAGSNSAFFILNDGTFIASAASTNKPVMWWDLDPANYAVVGKANTQLVVRISVATGVAPAVTIGGKLSSATFGGSAGNISPVIGSDVATAGIVNPAGSSASVTESLVVAFPSAGAYAPILTLSGATAANSATSVLYQLFALNS